MESTAPAREDDLVTVQNAISEVTSPERQRAARAALERLAAKSDRYAVLAEARAILKAMSDEQTTKGYDANSQQAVSHGYAACACAEGEEAIFNALNCLNAYACDREAGAAINA